MKNNKKGFTLAELLIVVAIIAVLVAISIPIFTAQLRKARLATNQANARAAYAMAIAEALDNDADTKTGATYVYTVKTASIADGSTAATISTPIADWDVDTTVGIVVGDEVAETWTVTIKDDTAPAFLGA